MIGAAHPLYEPSFEELIEIATACSVMFEHLLTRRLSNENHLRIAELLESLEPYVGMSTLH